MKAKYYNWDMVVFELKCMALHHNKTDEERIAWANDLTNELKKVMSAKEACTAIDHWRATEDKYTPSVEDLIKKLNEYGMEDR